MMKSVALLLAGVAALAIAHPVKAEPVETLKDVKGGNWNLSFQIDDGFNLSYKGVNIIRTSTLVVHNGQYTSEYASYKKSEKNVTIREIPGGKEVVFDIVSDTFKGTETITLVNDQASFKFDYGMPENIKDGKMDYCLGYLSTQHIAGKAFKTVGEKGEKSGIIPIKNWKTDTNYAPGLLYREATFSSVLGKMSIKVDGDLEGMELLDFRGSAVPMARKTPCLWSGIFQKKLDGGKKYSQTVTISIDPAAPTARLDRKSAAADTKISSLNDVKTTAGGEILIVPEPKELQVLQGNFTITPETKVVVANDATLKDLSGARQFASEVKAVYGLDISIIRENQVTAADKSLILVGEPARTKLLANAVSENKLVPPAKEEGYALKVTPTQVLVAGYDAAGSFYGMQTLRQLLREESGVVSMHSCQVNDWPTMKVRALLLYCGNQAREFHKKMIDRVLTRFKYNTLILEVSDIQWDTNRAMAPDFAMSKEDLKREISYARQNFMEVIPELSTFGHMGWAFRNKQNRDFAEDQDIPYAYCPSNEKSYQFIFSIFDEAIALFQPKYLHIGHDEVTNFGKFPKCPECSKYDLTTLIGRDVQKIYKHMSEKYPNIRLMMWSDMLLSSQDAYGGCNAPNAKVSKQRRDLIPKKIIQCDWHYSPLRSNKYPSIGLFKKEGFTVYACPWADPRNIAGFGAAAQQQQADGYYHTIWAGYNCNEETLKKEYKQFAALVLGSDYAWGEKTSDVVENIQYKVNELFDQSYQQKQPVRIHENGFVVDLSSFYNVKLADRPQGSGWIGLGPEFDLANAPVGKAQLKGITFQLANSTSENSAIRVASAMDLDAVYPDRVSVPLGTTAKSLYFLHTTARFDNLEQTSGKYVIHYGDGSQVEIPLIYARNICAWNDNRPCPEEDILWGADNGAGERVVLSAMEWKNPSPDKQIQSVEIVSANTEAGIALVGLSGIK